jgi:hypothetical protein
LHFQKVWISICFLFLGSSSIFLCAQDLKISRDINIRNDYSYEIIPDFGGRNLLVRERNRQFFVDIFDQDMGFVRTEEIQFDYKRISLDATIKRDSFIYFFHSYMIKDTLYVCSRIHDLGLNFILNDTLAKIKNDEFEVDFKSVQSENENVVGLYQMNKSKLLFFSFEIKGVKITPKLSLITDFKKDGSRDKFRSIKVKNDGNFFILFENENDEFDSDKHYFSLFVSKGNEQDLGHLPISAKGFLSTGVRMLVDELNNKITIVGLYGSKRSEECEGVYLFSQSYNNLNFGDGFMRIPFDRKLIEELYGKSKDKKPILRDHVIVFAQHRSDGGVIVVSEMQKEYNRRGIAQALPALGNPINGSNMLRSQMDFYNEDIVVLSIDPLGNIDWSLPLFKKQFSQDDQGAFSSFFHFSTQNRIRLIFNDEIKNNNTVSEYVLDPEGKYERHTVINTDYKELKLRFKEAVQVSYNEFIVPSERNFKLSLVKVKI